MTLKWIVECPCGFSFSTPHGKDEALAILRIHEQRIHKNDVFQKDSLKGVDEKIDRSKAVSRISIEAIYDTSEVEREQHSSASSDYLTRWIKEKDRDW